jgi:hypothetical protein
MQHLGVNDMSKIKRYVMWTPHQKGNQCVVDAASDILAIQEAIHQIGFFAGDWKVMPFEATNAKWQARLMQESQILTRQLS